MDIEPGLQRLDRIAGGRLAGRRVPLPLDAKLRHAFRAVTWLLAACLAPVSYTHLTLPTIYSV